MTALRPGALRLLAAASLLACGPAPPKSLLLIVSDTLRADALSCAGGGARTPHLCGLAERGALFERAYSNGPWTLPSSVSLLTGQHPGSYGRDPLPASGGRGFYHVAEEEHLLAEALSLRGYDVLAFVENEIALRPNALQGFELREVFEPRLPGVARIRDAVGIDLSDYRYARLLPILHYLLLERERPFFALQWIMDPHAVYFPPERFLARVPMDFSALPHPPLYYARLESRSNPERETRDLKRLADSLSAPERRFLKELYLREVESVDERVGYVLAALEQRGLSEHTLVVFTSDHGEGFGEHGRFLHSGRWLYEEFVHVPLILAGPGVGRGIRVDAPVSHVDLLPTLAALLGVELAPDAPGRSLAALAAGEPDAMERVPYIADAARESGYAALVRGPHKLIATPQGTELYDLSEDPGETRDLAASRPELRAELEARLAAVQEAERDGRTRRGGRVDARTLEAAARRTRGQLRALGYAE